MDIGNLHCSMKSAPWPMTFSRARSAFARTLSIGPSCGQAPSRRHFPATLRFLSQCLSSPHLGCLPSIRPAVGTKIPIPRHYRLSVSVKGSAFYAAASGALGWRDEAPESASSNFNQQGDGGGHRCLSAKWCLAREVRAGTWDPPKPAPLLGLPEEPGGKAKVVDYGSVSGSKGRISRGQAGGGVDPSSELGGRG
jgi:hypothetical protein